VRAIVIPLAVLATLLTIPVTASAGSCSLTGALVPAHAIVVSGSGFAPNATVVVTRTWSGSNAAAGGNAGSQTTTSQFTADATGNVTFNIDAGPGHGGTYRISASDGSCTATATATAIETAGGVNSSGGTSASDNPGTVVPLGVVVTEPPTDTEPVPEGPSPSPASAPVLAGVLAFIATAFVLAAGISRRRNDRH
jgi:hypothetical protein